MVESKENTNSMNTTAGEASQQDAKGPKERKYDPIIDDPLSSESGDGEGSGDESSDEGLEIEFPRDNAEELMTFLHREVTNLANMEDP